MRVSKSPVTWAVLLQGQGTAWHTSLGALMPQEVPKDAGTAVPYLLMTSLIYNWSRKKPKVTLGRNTRSEEKWIKRIWWFLVLRVLFNGNLSLYTNYICEENQLRWRCEWNHQRQNLAMQTFQGRGKKCSGLLTTLLFSNSRPKLGLYSTSWEFWPSPWPSTPGPHPCSSCRASPRGPTGQGPACDPGGDRARTAPASAARRAGLSPTEPWRKACSVPKDKQNPPSGTSSEIVWLRLGSVTPAGGLRWFLAFQPSHL